MNTAPPKPGVGWMKIATEKDIQTFAFAFATDVHLYMSVVNAPIIGPATLRRYFDASRAMFEYKGRYIAGMTILERNANGAIENVLLYHRPYDQVIAFAAELAQRLETSLR